jgi:ubiquinone/menaquinone biosynthesis C-methylase UbiE
MAATRRSYDRIAARYMERFEHELDGKPFDREFLDNVAAANRRNGWLVDLGGGPGQIGAYLVVKGLRILNVDLSLEMLRVAANLLGETARLQADMRALPFADNSIPGAIAFYSLIHIPPTELDGTLGELGRVVAAEGHLAVTFHVTPPAEADHGAAVADAALHIDEMLSEPVDLDFYFYESERIAAGLEAAGFEILQCTVRDPYRPEVEAQTRRAYVLAQKSP